MTLSRKIFREDQGFPLKILEIVKHTVRTNFRVNNARTSLSCETLPNEVRAEYFVTKFVALRKNSVVPARCIPRGPDKSPLTSLRLFYHRNCETLPTFFRNRDSRTDVNIRRRRAEDNSTADTKGRVCEVGARADFSARRREDDATSTNGGARLSRTERIGDRLTRARTRPASLLPLPTTPT